MIGVNCKFVWLNSETINNVRACSRQCFIMFNYGFSFMVEIDEGKANNDRIRYDMASVLAAKTKQIGASTIFHYTTNKNHRTNDDMCVKR